MYLIDELILFIRRNLTGHIQPFLACVLIDLCFFLTNRACVRNLPQISFVDREFVWPRSQ